MQSPTFSSHRSAYCPTQPKLPCCVLLIKLSIWATLLVSLDYIAAFDTIDHSILLDRLEHSFGFTGTALTWLQSYLTGCSQFVKLGNHRITPTPVTTGVPQCSVIGLLLFTI